MITQTSCSIPLFIPELLLTPSKLLGLGTLTFYVASVYVSVVCPQYRWTTRHFQHELIPNEQNTQCEHRFSMQICVYSLFSVGKIYIRAMNKLTHAVKLLALVRKARGSSLSKDTGHPDSEFSLSQKKIILNEKIICGLTLYNHLSEN
jgi:hypothetical protein